MTLAYTVITVAMYAAWWHKPLNISCAVRVPGKAVKKAGTAYSKSIWVQIFLHVMGYQDESGTLKQEGQVPTFWADCADDDENGKTADMIALAVAMVFGAVHCAAWSYSFPSHMEQHMWRASAISIVAVPVAMLLTFALDKLVDWLFDTAQTVVLATGCTVCAIVYIAARLMLLFLSFSTLRSLPFAAYQTVLWTTFIPHV